MEYLLKISICRRRFAHCRVIFEKGSSTRIFSMAIESLYAESQVSTTILRKRAYLDGYAARLLGFETEFITFI